MAYGAYLETQTFLNHSALSALGQSRRFKHIAAMYGLKIKTEIQTDPPPGAVFSPGLCIGLQPPTAE
jgi:hypothetical protein